MAGDAGSLAPAHASGCEVVGSHTISSVDPRTVPTPEPSAAVPLDGVEPRAVWQCVTATAGDDPSGLSQAHTFEQWLDDDWRLPTHRPDLGRAVVTAGRVEALAMVLVADDRAWNAFTGTRPEVRGRGLAGAVKATSPAALAEAGVITCGTGNDRTIAPMLAVNRRLGYAPSATTHLATLTRR